MTINLPDPDETMPLDIPPLTCQLCGAQFPEPYPTPCPCNADG